MRRFLSNLFLPVFLASLGAVKAAGPTPLLADTPEHCLKVLQSPDASLKQKVDACRQLAVLGGPEVVPVLAPLLEDPQLSHMARYALEPNPAPEAGAALRKAVGRVKGRLLVGVIGSLGVRRDSQAVPLLVPLLDHQDAEVAQAAARALGSIGTQEAVQALVDAASHAPSENLLAICEGIGRGLERLAAEGHRDVALAICDHYDDPGLPRQVRQAALRGAILLRGANGLALLRQALNGPDYTLFAAAVRTAIELKEPGVTAVLTGVLASLDADRQQVVVQALGERGDSQAAGALADLAQKGAPEVRLAAVRALGRLADDRVMPLLEGLLSSSDPAVRRAATEAYAALRNPAVDRAVLDMLQDLDAPTQRTAIELVQRRRLTAAVPALLQVAAKSSGEIRQAALRVLGELAPPMRLPEVLDLLARFDSEADRAAAADAAGRILSRAPTPASMSGALVDRLAKADPPRRRALIELLAVAGGPVALKAVQASLGDSDPGVRATALRVLGEWPDAAAAPVLLKLAKEASGPQERNVALRGVLRLAGQTDLPADRRLELCRQAAGLATTTDLRRLLLAALGRQDRPEAVELILPYLHDPQVDREARVALLSLADRLLRGQPSAEAARKLLEPLEQVVGHLSGNRANQARQLLQKARAAAR